MEPSGPRIETESRYFLFTLARPVLHASPVGDGRSLVLSIDLTFLAAAHCF